jgi:hypothetical protein
MLEDVMARVEDMDTKKKIEKTMDIVRREAQFVSEDLSRFKLDENESALKPTEPKG